MQNQKMIFYIDDDADDAQIVEEVLSDLGESTCIFQHSTDLIHLLNTPPPSASIILIDMNMPQVDGIELLTQIRAQEKFDEIPVIMMSNSAQPSKIEHCRQIGANLFMKMGF